MSYPCTHSGCPASYVTPAARDRHAAEPHTLCVCGRWFATRNMPWHLAQVKRRGIQHGSGAVPLRRTCGCQFEARPGKPWLQRKVRPCSPEHSVGWTEPVPWPDEQYPATYR